MKKTNFKIDFLKIDTEGFEMKVGWIGTSIRKISTTCSNTMITC